MPEIKIPEKQCVKVNSLGDCIEWVDFGDQKVAKFKEDAKCHTQFYDEWKRIVKGNKIKIMPED